MSWGELQGKSSGVNSSGGQAFTGPVTIDANSESNALRVTQTGNGNAILVEDSASTDSSPFVVTASGVVGIGTTPSATVSGVHVAKTITGATGVSSVIQAGVVQSDVTVSASGFNNTLSTQAATFTLVNYYGYLAQQGTIGAGTTVSNQSGFIASSSLTGATTNYGFQSSLAVGAGRWNFYAGGTARNFMAGRLDIGGTARNTVLAPSVTNPLNFLSSATTITDDATAASGTASWAPVNSFDNPTLAASNVSVTYTSAATVYIDGPPVAGTNVTITAPYAFYVADGRSTFNNNGATAAVSINQSGAGFGLNVAGSVGFGAPVTKTADFTVGNAENFLINNKSGSTCTVTLPSAATYSGRVILIKNIQAQQVVSASANVIPLGGGSASTLILQAAIGVWAQLSANGTNWEVIATNANALPHESSNVSVRKYIAANAGITWGAADNGAGKVRITSNVAHGLTTTPAVGASICVKTSQNTWVAGDFHEIATIVSATQIDLTTTYTTHGIPEFYLANEEVTVKTIASPVLRNNSVAILEFGTNFSVDAGGSSRRTKMYLGATLLNNNNFTSATNTFTPFRWGFKNLGATNSQRALAGENSTGYAANTGVPLTAGIETSAAGTISLAFLPAVANTAMELCDYAFFIRG